jgi:ADP-ribose pyrophosphatase YjhB (NUDIX family)
MDKRFNIRIYGLVEQDGKILLTDEFRLGRYMTKFPGGGLEFGEGPVDCLKRECLEELGQEIEVTGHFYTTDFYQPSLYLPDEYQMISIYYTARFVGKQLFAVSGKVNDFPPVDGAQAFRWVPVKDLHPDMFTLPIDKKVAIMLQKDELPDIK